MAFRDQLQRRLDSKRAEISKMESDLASAKAYAQALEDTLKLAPKDVMSEAIPATVLRPGTALAAARLAIVGAGKPLHISEILTALGREDTKGNRVSLAGSLATYARQNKIFTKPGPNVFGLTDMVTQDVATVN